MPYEIRKQKGKFCVFNKDTGDNKGCSDTHEMAVEHMRALYVHEKKLELTNTMLEDNGPVITGVAVTNIPHLPLPPVSVIEKDGNKMVRVPFLRAGIFRHKDGNLIFNNEVFNQMLKNHKSKKSHYGVSLNEKHIPGPALAWFDEDKGGKIEQEDDPEFGKLLVGYGKPTSEKILDLIGNKEYVYASVEFRPKHKSTMIAKLSSDDLEEIDEKVLLEEKMDEVTISKEEYEALKEKAEKSDQVAELETKLEEATNKVTELEAKVVELTPDKEDKTLELPEEFRLQMEEQKNEIARLKRARLEDQVESTILKAQARKDENGKGHSPILLEIAKAAMLGEPVAVNDNETIKLESGTPADVASYVRRVFVHLLNTIPGQVKLEGSTEGDEDRSFNFDGSKEYTKEELEDFWAESL